MSLSMPHRDKDIPPFLLHVRTWEKCTVTIPQGERYWLSDAAEELGANIIEVPMGYLTSIHKG